MCDVGAGSAGRVVDMDLGLDGRTALVTGGDSGIGWHTARLLLEEGATVVLSDQDPDARRTPQPSSGPARVGCTRSPPT